MSAVLQRLRAEVAFDRYFFRHAYAVELEPARLDALRMELIAGAPAVIADLQRLDAFLAQTAELDRTPIRPT